MATVLLGVVGGAIGGAFGATAAIIGQAVGSIAGSLADRAIVNALTPTIRQRGPRLTTTNIQASTEGAPIDRVYGRARISGQVIWTTRFEEVVRKDKSGGKGLGGPKVETTTYSYYGNFAVGLCEGPVAAIGRIWADGALLDQTQHEIRFHPGTESQEPDPLIEAKEGTDNAPAYRGTAYIVFENLALESWGNRLPQIAVEVFRPTGDLEAMLPGVAIISGNEFGFDPLSVRERAETGGETINVSSLLSLLVQGGDGGESGDPDTDFTLSIARLKALAPNVSTVMLVLPWFGDDLRCGNCTIRPKVDSAEKQTQPFSWLIGELSRGSAEEVSQSDGMPAFGGSPNDASVIRAIRYLTEAGLKVTLLPFMMMDIAADNVLPNPYSANAATAGQSAYPWRGRITCSPAPGFAGTVDKTATAATQVTAFMGTAAPGDFGGSGETVTYSGPAEWRYRRFFLHYAKLAAIAGGVDSFLIGSEMVALTAVRSSASAYPFVSALKTLAADVRSIVGPNVEIGYAADWSEYHSHRPADGSGDVNFHLDPLWSDAAIDFVGIDNYFPLADWRDGDEHLDYDPAGPTSIYDQDYLRANVEGGEYFDWYYADQASRDAQARLPITDGAYAKPWVYRQKDLRGWWSQPHKNRSGGVEAVAATAWTPQSKPIRFVELGCAAVDKGANQPNLFVDPKSTESGWPHYSTRARDDAMQRAWLEAMLGYWTDNNPVSAAYGGPMVDLGRSTVWCWDARPWPSFPLDRRWGDADAWEQGHWLSGRLGGAPAAETVRTILQEAGFADFAIEPLPAIVDGVTTGALTSARAMLEALQPLYQFDAVESDGVIKFIARAGRAPVATIEAADLVAPDGGGPVWRQTRAQETDLPDAVKLSFGDPASDDQPGAVEARRSAGGSRRIAELSVPVLVSSNMAALAAERTLHAAWTGRERAEFALPPSMLALDAGDVIRFRPTGQLLGIDDIAERGARTVSAGRVDPLALAPVRLPSAASGRTARRLYADADVAFIDGPLLQDDDSDHAAYAAGTMLPFGQGIVLLRNASAGAELSAFTTDSVLASPATMGVTTADFYSGPVWRWDRVNALSVRLTRGDLSSAEETAVLNGANAAAVQNADGEWEVLQFATATPTGTRTFTLTGLLRGLRGTEHAMRAPLATGARFVLLDEAVQQTGLPAPLVGLPLAWRCGPADRLAASSAYIAQTVTLAAKARRPFAPVHLAAAFEPDGDIHLSWTRRSRIGGDSWEQVEVPLGETEERYEVEILDGATVVRTVTGLGAPAWLYQLADQTADFGAPIAAIAFRVCQVSASFGRGVMAEYP
ncbi:hypothetical protein ASD44_09595 [Mesorhizobium sp. Root554]|uniref:baseplate multidomain protein megatron n=1 Tax=unclassified Mesorhizobium TaxID=325217 RepID=UPI0006FF1FCE|nr:MULTISPECIES: glycoside hydrolase/phage tail family protein [unclassified Mesorhizobium]KQZ14296.1 hypothetical protein ASD27_09605 [Mesorhizobium sp. Root1471]KQZ36807.1 hypothetical protein ASD44_09595 [Mesorhizobium sp. Root554]